MLPYHRKTAASPQSGRIAQPFKAFALNAQAKMLKLPETSATARNLVNRGQIFKMRDHPVTRE